jgi:hypothetical protein
MNLAILIVDYDTYIFEGTNLSHYVPCGDCGVDSLPFEFVFDYAWDLASAAFSYTATGDTLFRAGVYWMGTGEIEVPEVFIPPEAFTFVEEEIDQPSDPELFLNYEYPTIPEDELIARTDTAWSAVSRLDLVHSFAEDVFRVGYYFWTPSVFSLAKAKWVIFLYQDLSG